MSTMRLMVVFCCLAAAARAAAGVESFDKLQPGQSPDGWAATLTGRGQPQWAVVSDSTAPTPPHVLKQSGEATYPLCIKQGTNLKDGYAEVKFKGVSGKRDQAGGVIWRCADADNYYIARANALENNVTIYHTVKGKRTAFKNVDIPVSGGVWHRLRVEFQGENFTVLLDGKKVIEARNTTFKAAGKVGLWTKADSVTLFDDFSWGELTQLRK